MKNLYIKQLPTKQSTGNHIPPKKDKRSELEQIFLDESSNSEFLGFDLETEDDLDYDSVSESSGFNLELDQTLHSENNFG